MIGDVIPGVVVDITPEGELTIKATIPLDDYVKKNYQKVMVYMVDGRELSDKQRRFCYSLIAAIAEWMGENSKSADRELTKQYLKLRYITTEMEPMAAHLFSMANAPKDVIVGFLTYLIDFVLQNDVPTRFSLLEYVDENSIQSYIYSCLINKKCCICGRHSDLHHVSRIGAGNNREEVVQLGMSVLPLCREHHTENHNTGDTVFFAKYHLDGGIEMDRTLCRMYKVKAEK